MLKRLSSFFLILIFALLGATFANGIDLRFIEGGSFIMGHTTRTNAMPRHQVQVDSFSLMAHEVTVGEYETCVDAGGCEPAFMGYMCNSGQAGAENHPINCITWFQGNSFCQWSELRLPSESEWEYAAKSKGQDLKFPWGNDSGSCEYAVGFDTHFGCGRKSTWEVCSKPLGSTQQGLCDMGGNVWEWVADDAHGDYEGAPTHSGPWVDSEPNPGSVYRGGGYLNFIPTMETTYRRLSSKDSVSYELGFRCAK